MNVVVTGGAGFLGWHARARLLTEPDVKSVPVTRADWSHERLVSVLSDAVLHYAEIERFQGVGGTGLLRVRKVLTDEIFEFDVNGEQPVIIDMPTLWSHSITNTGSDPLITFFWTNELYEADHLDTWALPVTDGPDMPSQTTRQGTS